MSSLFNLHTYQAVIEAQLERDTTGKGAKSRLAATAGVQPAYLSQVLAGTSHLSLDQAANLAEDWDFDDIETDYFLTLVSLGRAGSPHLVKRLKKKLNSLRTVATENPFTERPKDVDWELASNYYSDAIFSRVHLLLRIPKLQNIEALSEHLGLSKSELRLILENLKNHGLVSHSFDRWLPVEKRLHAEPGSAFAKMHHRNWFLQSANKLSTAAADDLFYSAVHTLSEDDFKKISNLILGMIQKSRKVVQPSADEVGAAFTIGWFKI